MVLAYNNNLSQLLSWILTDVGYRVIVMDNKNDALALVSEIALHLIILVESRPRTETEHFLRVYRQTLGGQVPVVLLAVEPPYAAWTAELGADACLTLPFDLDDLYLILARFLEPSRP